MPYHLLTGATGLVGRYLLHRLTVAGMPLAVLARPGKMQTASDRIEAILQHWERLERRSLPRPVILQGELAESQLGLSRREQQWIAGNCAAVVHSAAAMVFRADERGEPHRTNVQGMRNLLDCCRRLGIRRFHHVSTAYLCGLRQGRIMEDELDVCQTLGNVYEESKLEAEKILRAANWLEQTTIFRPASVIGDSQNGYTANFHGFYLPLQLAYSFAGTVPPEEMNERFIKRLGLGGEERKNFVPVDWVASAIAYIVTHAEHHGRTYHLASPKGVSVRLLQSVVQEAIRRYGRRSIAAAANPKELEIYEKLFHDQLLIYRSHWRDDPIFDLTNSQRALGHMPCPEMDFDLLLRVARWPVENHFTVAKYAEVTRPIDLRRMLTTWVQGAETRSESDSVESIALQVTGAGGGQWRLLASGEKVVGAEPGLSYNGTAGYYLNSRTLAMLIDGSSTIEQSLRDGRLITEGPADARPRLMGILRTLIQGLAADGKNSPLSLGEGQG